MFLIAAGVVAVGFLVLLFLPQLELSTKSGIQARQEDEDGTATGDPAEADDAARAAGAAAPTSVSAAQGPAAGDGTPGDGVATRGPRR